MQNWPENLKGKQIGAGGYKRAFDHSADARKVVLEVRHSYTDLQMKSIYYLNAIAHALFPAHIPKVSQAGNVRDGAGSRGHLMVEKVEHDPAHRALQKKIIQGDGYTEETDEILNRAQSAMDRDPEIQRFLEAYEASGLVAGFAKNHRWGVQDLVRKPNGGFSFVDFDPAWEEPGDLPGYSQEQRIRFDPVILKKSIENLESPLREQTLHHFGRLMSLCREAGFIDINA